MSTSSEVKSHHHHAHYDGNPGIEEFVEPLLFGRRQDETTPPVGYQVPKRDFSKPKANVIGIRYFLIITGQIKIGDEAVSFKSEQSYTGGTTWFDAVVFTASEIKDTFPNNCPSILVDAKKSDKFVKCRDGIWRHFGQKDKCEKTDHSNGKVK